jgi:plastocyanin domain-containing protein
MNRHWRVAGVCIGIVVAVAGCGGAGGAAGGAQQVRVEVTDAGFTPAVQGIRKDRPVTITFERMTEKTCATDVVFPALRKGYDLPLHKPVEVTLTAAEVGDTLKFNCSMNMIHGVLVAK